jgi:hypothetical protein
MTRQLPLMSKTTTLEMSATSFFMYSRMRRKLLHGHLNLALCRLVASVSIDPEDRNHRDARGLLLRIFADLSLDHHLHGHHDLVSLTTPLHDR